MGITKESQEDPRAELFDPDDDCSTDEAAGGDPSGQCAITPTCTLRCHLRWQEGETQLNDAVVDTGSSATPGGGS